MKCVYCGLTHENPAAGGKRKLRKLQERERERELQEERERGMKEDADDGSESDARSFLHFVVRTVSCCLLMIIKLIHQGL